MIRDKQTIAKTLITIESHFDHFLILLLLIFTTHSVISEAILGGVMILKMAACLLSSPEPRNSNCGSAAERALTNRSPNKELTRNLDKLDINLN